MSNGKIAQTIADATGTKILELHSCQNVTKDDFNRGVTYAYTMKSNLEAIKENRLYVMDRTLFNIKPNAKWAKSYEKIKEILLDK